MRTSAVFASIIALAISAPIELPVELPVEIPSLPVLPGTPTLPELPAASPSLPIVGRDIANVKAADLVNVDVASPSLSVLPQVGKLPAKRDIANVKAADLVNVDVASPSLSVLPQVGKLPTKRDIANVKAADLVNVDVASPSVSVLPTLPKVSALPARRQLVNIDVFEPEVGDVLVAIPAVPAKRDGLGVPALSGVGVPTEVLQTAEDVANGVTNGVTTPLKRDIPDVTDNAKVVEEAIKTLTELVDSDTQSVESQETIAFVIASLAGLI